MAQEKAYNDLRREYAKNREKGQTFKDYVNSLLEEIGTAKYSISEIIGDSGTDYGVGVILDSDLLTGLTDSERKDMVKLRVVEELAGNDFVAYDGENNPVTISIAQKDDVFKNQNGKRKQVIKELYSKFNGKEVKQEAVVLADELIATSQHEKSEPAKYPHGWLDNNGQNNWDKRTVFIQEKNKTVWKATLNIANSADGRKILYDIDPIKKVEGAKNVANTSTTTNIPQNGTIVNGQFSLSGGNKSEINKITDDGLTMTYVRVPNQNTPNYGSTYGQNIEPAGEYI